MQAIESQILASLQGCESSKNKVRGIGQLLICLLWHLLCHIPPCPTLACLSTLNPALIPLLPEGVQSCPWDRAVPPGFLSPLPHLPLAPQSTLPPMWLDPAWFIPSLDISALSPHFGPLSPAPLAHSWPLQTLLSEPPCWPASWSVVWHDGSGAGCMVGWLACSEGASWGSFQARLGSQGDAQAMQAVRTARGNSFCVDCDAPSKRCHAGRGAHREGRGLQPP